MRQYYRAKHILLEEDDDTEYVKEQIEAGVSFEELAREFSECESASNGGSLGRFPSGAMVPEFERALSRMEVGEIRYSVKTKMWFSYYLTRRVKKRPLKLETSFYFFNLCFD